MLSCFTVHRHAPTRVNSRIISRDDLKTTDFLIQISITRWTEAHTDNLPGRTRRPGFRRIFSACLLPLAFLPNNGSDRLKSQPGPTKLVLETHQSTLLEHPIVYIVTLLCAQ